MGSNFQCQPRLVSATMQFNGGTSISWNGVGIQSLVRSAVGVYTVVWQNPRHFFEQTISVAPFGPGTVKAVIQQGPDLTSGCVVVLTNSAGVPGVVDGGFSLSAEPLRINGGVLPGGPVARAA